MWISGCTTLGLYAAEFVTRHPNLELIQAKFLRLRIDAITIQVQEILNDKGKVYTVLKIDEGANLRMSPNQNSLTDGSNSAKKA